MPRDSSGNYILPLGNPVADDTIIESMWANPTMSDIANQLNNVLTRDGLLGPLAPVKFIDGVAVAPGITFLNAPGTGFYRDSTAIHLVWNGVKIATFSTDGLASYKFSGKLGYFVSITDPMFGAVGGGIIDDTVAIQAALDYVATYGGVVIAPVGKYRTTAPLYVNGTATTFQGQGCGDVAQLTAGSAGVVGTGYIVGQATTIFADFTTGPVFWVKKQNCMITELSIDSSTARKAAAVGENHGIRVESADVAGATTRRTRIYSVRIINQPADGILMVNDIVQSRLDFVSIAYCNRNGISIAGGSYSSRTNRSRPGQIDIWNCGAQRTGGHAIRIGGGSWEVDASDLPYRVTIDNWEPFYNCITPAVLVNPSTPAGSYISGENIGSSLAAWDGRLEFPAIDDHLGLDIRGWNMEFMVPRFINCSPNCARITAHPLYTLSRSITFTSPYITNTLQGAGFYNPAILYDANCRYITVTSGLSLSIIAKLSSRIKGTSYHEDYNGALSIETRESVIRVERTIANNAVATITMGAISRGILTLSGSNFASGACTAHFRVGDVNGHMSIMEQVGALVVGTTGPLTGTTGAVGNLTVSVSLTTPTMYVENRTGASAAYAFEFNALAGEDGINVSSMA